MRTPSPPDTARPSLLARIFELGEQLLAAIAAGRLVAAAALVQERDLLVSRLEAFHHPSEVDPSWKQWRDRLAAQHEALTDAFTARTQQTTDTRHHVETLTQAHRRYEQDHASPSGVLHPDFAA